MVTEPPDSAALRPLRVAVHVRCAPAVMGNPSAMSSASRNWPFTIRRCTRCTREAAVVVVADRRSGTVAACVEHLEWAFFLGVDEWSGRRPTA